MSQYSWFTIDFLLTSFILNITVRQSRQSGQLRASVLVEQSHFDFARYHYIPKSAFLNGSHSLEGWLSKSGQVAQRSPE